MARKAKLGPGIVRVERLSDGEVVLEPIVDDFTELPIPHADSALLGQLHGPIADPQLAVDALRKLDADSALRMLRAIGLVDTALPEHEPKALAGCRLGEHVMVLPKRPFRRI